jgi:hypothetical protein
MINLRCVTADAVGVVIIPPFGSRPNVASPRSISLACRESITLSSIPGDEAADWITAKSPMLAAAVGSRRTATRVVCGASFLSSSAHFPPMLYSNARNPVVLPPRPSQAADEACPDGISDIRENDRDAGRDPLEGHHG